MITLYLEHPVSQQVRRIGPAPYFRLKADTLVSGPDDVVIGTYQNGVWTVNGDVFLTLAADAPARVRFEGNGSGNHDFGPFERLKVVDGAIRHGPNAVELLARLDEEKQAWYVYSEQKNYPVAIVAPQ